MSWLLTLRRRRVGLQSIAALALALLLGCSGGDPSGPSPDVPNGPPAGPPTHPQPNPPPPADQPPLPPAPPPPSPHQPPAPPDQPPADDYAGVYVLTRVNDGFPGQLTMVANPDGSVVGLYRFAEGSTLALRPDGTWSMSLDYSDDKVNFVIDDAGQFTENAGDLLFASTVFGDQFLGSGQPGAVAIGYDLDGDGGTDLILGFARLLPPGT
jgi:hypothetical protein